MQSSIPSFIHLPRRNYAKNIVKFSSMCCSQIYHTEKNQRNIAIYSNIFTMWNTLLLVSILLINQSSDPVSVLFYLKTINSQLYQQRPILLNITPQYCFQIPCPKAISQFTTLYFIHIKPYSHQNTPVMNPSKMHINRCQDADREL